MTTDAETTSDAAYRRGSILGTRVRRVEDPRLLTGAARYLADLALAEGVDARHDLLQMVLVPSPIAHGRLGAVHVDEARDLAGVHEVWTAAELGLDAFAGFVNLHDDFSRPALAVDRVRFAGEPLAAVFATDAQVAADAAATIWAQIDPLDPVIDPEAALEADATLLFPTRGHNRAFVEQPDVPVDLDAISSTVVRGRYVNQRVAVAPLETDGCLAELDHDGRLVLWASTQMPHLLHRQLAAVLAMDPERIRVRTPQVGGGFGGKAGLHHPYVIACVAAMRFGRPVMWSPWRSADMVELPHGRAQVQYAEAGFDDGARLTGLRLRLVGDGGAYPTIGAALPGGTRRMGCGTYDVPAYQCDVVSAATTTTPVGAYRGAGRPEATALVERLMDQAARELGVDPVELRRRNLLGSDAFPHTTPTGLVYDSGDYLMALERAVEVADYDGWRAEQRRRRHTGDRHQIGIGVACYVEVTAAGTMNEFAALEIRSDGTARLRVGTAAHGQGHATSYAMIVADATGLELDAIEVVDGDTDVIPRGGGTGGSRSLQLAGSATRRATQGVVEQARELVARWLEADVADIVVDTTAGTVGVAGVPAGALKWAEIAHRAAEDGDELSVEHVFEQAGATSPFGAHISIGEVDVETGRARVVRHVAVDDCGTVIAPMLVEGQQHGGIASGIGQALYEEIRYDDNGNLLTSTFADYALPSAVETAGFVTVSTQTPTPLNPLGAKGIGEAATIGATPAVQNAVIDAVAHLGVRHIDMPCTPERVWRALDEARRDAHVVWREPPAVFATLREEATEAVDPAIAEAADGI